MGSPRALLDVSTLIRGPVKPALELVAHPRLELLERIGLTTDGVCRTHATRLQISFPLLNDLKAGELQVSATSNIVGLTITDVLKGKANRNVTLSVNNKAPYSIGESRFRWNANRFWAG